MERASDTGHTARMTGVTARERVTDVRQNRLHTVLRGAPEPLYKLVVLSIITRFN